jgi:hypothetical protein
MRAIARTSLRLAPAVAITLVLGASSAARADTIWFEAEDVDADVGNSPVVRTITTPMRVVDRADASGGASIEVQNGLNSQSSVPTLGRACYKFTVASSGTYRVWGRVIARTDNDDSYWVNMDGGSFIKWNNIAPGANWHWDFVHTETNTSTPSTFSLSSGDHTLCFAYREDDTRLDVIVVTSDTSFNPNAAITGAPAPPFAPMIFFGHLSLQVAWTTVLGATSYSVERSNDGATTFSEVASGVTGHSFTDTSAEPNFDIHYYRVIAHGPTGNSSPSEERCCGEFIEDFGPFSNAVDLSLTSPMQITTTPILQGIGVTSGSDSLNAVPTTGWARLDFRTATAGSFLAHAQISAPNPDSDSFWVRIDQQPWIKWNNIVPHEPCDYDIIHNSDAGGTPVTFTVSTAGSHTFEIAYREVNTKLTRLWLYTQPTTDEGFGLCFD